MNMVNIIARKRDGFALTRRELSFFAEGAADGSIPDYQLAAMLMAIYLNGLDDEETAMLTEAMAAAGDSFDLSGIDGVKVDKHSTGGVADTTTLILAPLVASLGVPVIKMSGAGLGFSGGTLDKLSSIPGFRMDLDMETALRYTKERGIALMGQTGDIAPADKRLYALRDVTATVESLPLIAASIMSKKLAAGADAIVLDVKCGSGAFMKTEADALKLARLMIAAGRRAGRRMCAVITGMDEPLGSNIGNSLEVIEAAETLKGRVKGELLEVSLTLGAHMLRLAGRAANEGEGRALLEKALADGDGIKKFKELVKGQGGNPEALEDYSLLPQAAHRLCVKAEKSGYIYSMDTAAIGAAGVETGAGRHKKEDIIDYGAGIIMKKRLGDCVRVGDEVAEIHSGDASKGRAAAKMLLDAIEISADRPVKRSAVREVLE